MGQRTEIRRVFADVDALNRGAAEELCTRCTGAVERQGKCSLVLSGGNTPQGLYQLLAREYRERVPWKNMDIYWGDERYVPHNDPKSNYRRAREILLDQVPIEPTRIHPIPTSSPDPEEAARSYESLLRQKFTGGRATFDIVLLGVGTDGHVASLFPGSTALQERERWVVVTSAPAPPVTRISLTFPALNAASEILLLVSGVEKSAILLELERANKGTGSPLPVSKLSPAGPLLFFVDRQAAGA